MIQTLLTVLIVLLAAAYLGWQWWPRPLVHTADEGPRDTSCGSCGTCGGCGG